MKIRDLFESTRSVMYHGTNNQFNFWDLSADRVNRGSNVTGIYFTPRREEALEYGSRIITAEVTYNKPFYAYGRKNEITPSMVRKAKELLLRYTTYKEQWLDNAILPSLVEKGLDAIKDVNGDIKREILIAGGYDAYIDGAHVVILNPSRQNIMVVE